jgi:RNA polymerase sigma factor (sigma-70 family)
LEVSYQNSHQQIIERCRKGEQKAYYEIYKLYSKAMYNICYRILGSEQAAEDALQEAFVSAYQNLHSYEGRAAFGAWLKKIVVNKAISHLKREKLNLMGIDEHFDAVYEDNHDDSSEYKLEAVKRGIQKLPNGFRIVLSLYLLEGYDHSEIAEILEVSESTSKTQYIRAKAKLKQILKEEVYYE